MTLAQGEGVVPEKDAEDAQMRRPDAGGEAPRAPPFRPTSFSPNRRPPGGSEPAQRTAAADDRIEALQSLIDELPEEVALLDESWRILAVNRNWTRKASQSVRRELYPGRNYRELLEGWAAAGNRDCAIVVAALQELASGARRSFEHVYTQDVRGQARDYKVKISTFTSGGTPLATITRHEITFVTKLAEQTRRLEKSLLSIQEEERRRIGRELHDAIAQLLVALHLCNLRLKHMHPDPESKTVFSEVDETLERVNEEIRAISYLLHPPTLDERGLVESIDAMAQGFARRTGLRISFWFDGQIEEWDMVVQASLYRVAQEALTNVHRHAEADKVGIRLVAKPGRFLHLIIEDDGIGIPNAPLSSIAPLGVGIAGMQSRIAELGGRLTIHRLDKGTCIIASVPLSPRIIARERSFP